MEWSWLSNEDYSKTVQERQNKMSQFGDELYRKRVSMGMTQFRFAEWVGLSQSLISRIEMGRPVSLLTLQKISDQTGTKFSVKVSQGKVEIFFE